ncbi:hypothetical protein NDU88_003458 [Pleurodeles waltl]|uniref:SAP domain-containing protein n=1 Tax=Pleurodeles waltl TaxID=8319 RepID=A0AAV7UYI1_PLEWA|nr:hypothetical protein NDU88_003458 [Pleurodeles waltl]
MHRSLAGEKKQRTPATLSLAMNLINMPQSGDAPAVSTKAVFELEKLESYTVAQLKRFCKDLACLIRSSTRKEELQKALRALVEAKEAGGHTEEEDEGTRCRGFIMV